MVLVARNVVSMMVTMPTGVMTVVLRSFLVVLVVPVTAVMSLRRA